MITNWHCDISHTLVGDYPIAVSENCTTTGSTSQLATTTPLIVRDDGSLIFGIAIIIFFLSIFFWALIFGALGLKQK